MFEHYINYEDRPELDVSLKIDTNTEELGEITVNRDNARLRLYGPEYAEWNHIEYFDDDDELHEIFIEDIDDDFPNQMIERHYPCVYDSGPEDIDLEWLIEEMLGSSEAEQSILAALDETDSAENYLETKLVPEPIVFHGNSQGILDKATSYTLVAAFIMVALFNRPKT